MTDKVIPIPQTVVQPFIEVKQGFAPFKLYTGSLNWHPSDDTLLGTELREDGKTFTMDSDRRAMKPVDTVDNEIIRFIIVHDNVDYASCSDLLYSLVEDARVLVETKAAKDLQNDDVIQKAKAGTEFCAAVTKWNRENGGKPWQYALISHEDVRIHFSFHHLIDSRVNWEQKQIELQP